MRTLGFPAPPLLSQRLWVDGLKGSDTEGDGTVSLPFKGIQKAIDIATSDFRISLTPTDYPGDLVMGAGKTNLLIETFSVEGSPMAKIIGKHSFSGSQRMRFKGVNLDDGGLGGSGILLDMNGSLGANWFDECTFSVTPGNKMVRFGTGAASFNIMRECMISGHIDMGLTGTPVGNCSLVLIGCADDGSGFVSQRTGYTYSAVDMISSPELRDHTGGIFSLDGSGAVTRGPVATAEFNGTLNSTAPLPFDYVIRADNAGSIGLFVNLVFNGVRTLNAEIVRWNADNSSNTVTLISGDGDQIMGAGGIGFQDVPFLGGHDGRCITSTAIDDPGNQINLRSIDLWTGGTTKTFGSLEIQNCDYRLDSVSRQTAIDVLPADPAKRLEKTFPIADVRHSVFRSTNEDIAQNLNQFIFGFFLGNVEVMDNVTISDPDFSVVQMKFQFAVGKGMQCNFSGRVRVYCSIALRSVVLRPAVQIALRVNDTLAVTGPYSSSYIRSFSGANMDSSSISDIIDVVQGDIIYPVARGVAETGTVTQDAAQASVFFAERVG